MDAPATTAAPAAAGPTGGWAVDPDELRSFSDAVLRARSYLDTVQRKVSRMQGAELTPQLGTSPVGQQLAKKFDDRLNSTDGLRVMLDEAMKRMQKFVASAESAARSYEAMDENAKQTFDGVLPDVGGLLTDVIDGIMSDEDTGADHAHDHGHYGDDDHDDHGKPDDHGGGSGSGHGDPGSDHGGADSGEAGSGSGRGGPGSDQGGSGDGSAGGHRPDPGGSGGDHGGSGADGARPDAGGPNQPGDNPTSHDGAHSSTSHGTGGGGTGTNGADRPGGDSAGHSGDRPGGEASGTSGDRPGGDSAGHSGDRAGGGQSGGGRGDPVTVGHGEGRHR